MPLQRVVVGDRHAAYRAPPVAGPPFGELDLAHHQVADAGEQVLLALHVVVDRHRLDAELAREVAHGQRGDALTIGEVHGRAQHALATERLPPLDDRFRPSRHDASLLTTLRCTLSYSEIGR